MRVYLVYAEIENALRWLEDPSFELNDTEAMREWNWSLSVNLLRFC